MLTAKRALSVEELDAQTAVELPERETMLVTVVIGNLLSGNTVTIDVRNVNVAAQICAAVLAQDTPVTCEIQQ
jgi:hypothetical protein